MFTTLQELRAAAEAEIEQKVAILRRHLRGLPRSLIFVGQFPIDGGGIELRFEASWKNARNFYDQTGMLPEDNRARLTAYRQYQRKEFSPGLYAELCAGTTAEPVAWELSPCGVAFVDEQVSAQRAEGASLRERRMAA